jgi:hypothetical protein
MAAMVDRRYFFGLCCIALRNAGELLKTCSLEFAVVKPGRTSIFGSSVMAHYCAEAGYLSENKASQRITISYSPQMEHHLNSWPEHTKSTYLPDV